MNLKTKLYPRKPEKVNDRTYRLRVLGGWLVTVHHHDSSASFFIEDENEDWVLEPDDGSGFFL